MTAALWTEQDMVPERESSSVRTCAGCRERQDRETLLRVVRGSSGELAPDPGSRLPGRGAHVHLRRACLERACRGGFARAFRAPVRVDAEAFASLCEARLVARRDALLLAARRARALAIGSDAVRESVVARRARLLVVATDAEGRRAELEEGMARLGRACAVFGTKVALGQLLGRQEVAVVSVLDDGLAEAVAAVTADIAAIALGSTVPEPGSPPATTRASSHERRAATSERGTRDGSRGAPAGGRTPR